MAALVVTDLPAVALGRLSEGDWRRVAHAPSKGSSFLDRAGRYHRSR